jgi:signal transduction histidine kinase
MSAGIKKINSYFYFIFIFVLAQLAWIGLLGLWIYWYVSNSIIFEEVGEQLSPQLKADSPSAFVFVGGILLIVAMALGISVMFRNLNVQLKLNRLYDNFISNITHELNSPLASGENKTKFINYMMNDARRLNNLINTILEISRLEQKNIAHDYDIYKGGKIIRSLVHESAEQFQLEEDKIKILDNSDARIVIDKNAMKIVVDNLIDNALKYSPGDPEIEVKIENKNKRFVIEFTDKGIGVDQKQAKKIFKKFYRVSDNNIPSVKGTGLGLYWVREIIKSHGGNILCLSEGLNKGTTFQIELPIYGVSQKRLTKKLLKMKNKPSKRKNNGNKYE